MTESGMTGMRVLILAGRRDGDAAVARAAGVSAKALAPVAGVPMLERVAGAVRAALPDADLYAVIDADPVSDALLVRLGLSRIAPGGSPAASVEAALTAVSLPVLIVTADHALLTPVMVRHFLSQIPAGTDGAIAVARRATIEAKYVTRRTYLRFADDEVSGCNLFYLGAGAARAIAFWRTLEADRKHPFKMIRRLGPVTLIRFGLGLLDLKGALRRLSRLTGAQLMAVDMPFAEAAIDVDHPEDLTLAEQILAERILVERILVERRALAHPGQLPAGGAT